MQVAKAPASSLHWKVEPASEEEKLKLALVLLVGSAGALSMVVLGAALSTVTVRASQPWIIIDSGAGVCNRLNRE